MFENIQIQVDFSAIPVLHIIGLILKVRKTKGKELLKKYNKRLI
jgi:hypothetical protein